MVGEIGAQTVGESVGAKTVGEIGVETVGGTEGIEELEDDGGYGPDESDSILLEEDSIGLPYNSEGVILDLATASGLRG